MAAEFDAAPVDQQPNEEVVASSVDKLDPLRTNVLTYPGDVRAGVHTVVGGRWVVVEMTYDAEENKTRVKVAKLIDPMALLERGQQ